MVADDDNQVLALTLGLEREGLAVSAVREANDALEAVASIHPDVILLDVVLRGDSGIELCREIRDRGIGTPIIMVSSRDDEFDVVVGIEVGADDYLLKPIRIRELVARIGAQLRRAQLRQIDAGPRQVAESDGSSPILQANEITMDSARHEVTVRGQEVELPLREFQVLRELLAHAGRVVTRDDLLEKVWGFDYDGDPRIVATLIGRLRARIERDPDRPKNIVTIRGVGYRLNDRP
ncbi:MAG TPA: response regulator transcription factor [Acidimicrobiales bacterium]|nr:response regulator transcription factor [Acidimicrobiales bacterium]